MAEQGGFRHVFRSRVTPDRWDGSTKSLTIYIPNSRCVLGVLVSLVMDSETLSNLFQNESSKRVKKELTREHCRPAVRNQETKKPDPFHSNTPLLAAM